jgi:hypothetical protein
LSWEVGLLADIERFVTHMKIEELRKQRDRLRAIYDELERHAGDAETEAEMLSRLYDGLRELKFAERPLHPDVANLNILLFEANNNADTPESVSFWRKRLERELAQGRLRTEFVYTFGALLEEFTQQAGKHPAGDPRQTYLQLLARLQEADPVPDYERLLPSLLDAFPSVRDESWQDYRLSPPNKNEVKEIAEILSRNTHRSAHLRRQAERVANDDILCNELADALALMIDHVDEWRWPEEGVRAFAKKTGDKWRLFLDEDLPSAIFLSIYGKYLRHITATPAHKRYSPSGVKRQGYIMATPSRSQYINRLLRIARLQDLNAPDIILQNEYRLLEEAKSAAASDIWGTGDIDVDASLEEQLEQVDSYGSINSQRFDLWSQLRDAVWDVDYRQERYAAGVSLAVRCVNAEVRLWQAAYPDKPLYVLKLDLKDFYPSISHDMLLFVLEHVGLGQNERDLIARILRVLIQDNGQVTEVQQGLMNDRVLSHVLGEMILFLLEEYIYRTASVEIVRVVDDICVLASSADDILAAWQAAQEFCSTTGLDINLDKSGAVCIGGELPAGLPEGLPRWKLLQLRPDGEWQIDRTGFERRLLEAREQVMQEQSVLARVEAYNRATREMLDNMALDVCLGSQHRENIRALIAEYHYSFNGDCGIMDILRDAIHSGFWDGDTSTAIPEAWFYFPVTAGGLGLIQPMVEVASYAQSAEALKPAEIPGERRKDWQRKDNAWASYYRYWIRGLQPAQPASTVVMETLVKDFIERGTQMSGTKQTKLRPYWRWILYIYGPQIIESFGSFRFLITELVPLQLILQGRGVRIGLGSAGDDEAFHDDIPF